MSNPDVVKQAEDAAEAAAEATNDESTTESTEESQEGAEEAQERDDEPVEERLKRTEDELAKVRREAADRRVANRELNEKLAEAKTEDDIKAAVSEYEDKVASLERAILIRDVADEVGLPKALRDRLKGETKEELEADAKALASLIPQGRSFDEEEAGGGLDPADSAADDDDDIRRAVERARRGR